MLSKKLGGEGRTVFVEPTFSETSEDEQHDTRRGPVGRRRETPLV